MRTSAAFRRNTGEFRSHMSGAAGIFEEVRNMRLASYSAEGIDHYGIVIEGGVIDLDSRLDEPDLQSLVESGSLDRAVHFAQSGRPDRSMNEITFMPPIRQPNKIWCIGVNYAQRNEEYKDGSDTPQYPSLFCRASTSFAGHNCAIERPRVSEQFDYEGEIALIVGRKGRHISRDRAHEYIFGLTLCNEGSVRDWLRHGKFNVTQGKNFDRSGSIGPWVVTSDEISIFEPLELTTRVNGEVRQRESTERMIFPFDFLIAYLSTFATLLPGDVIVTGTPTGAGVRFDPPRWLRPGDRVEVEVPQIGVLRNIVEDEKVAGS